MALLWSVVAIATLIPKPSHLHVHTASTYNVNVECCGTYSCPNKNYVSETRVGMWSSFRNSAGLWGSPIGHSTLISPT